MSSGMWHTENYGSGAKKVAMLLATASKQVKPDVVTYFIG